MLETLLVLPALFAATTEIQPRMAPALLPPPVVAAADAAEGAEAWALPEVQFPTSSGPLHLDVDEEGFSITYEMLVRRYGELTGATMVFSEETKSLLASRRVQLDSALDVPAAEAVTAMETLLAHRGFVLGLSQAGESTIAMVVASDGAERNLLRSKAVGIRAEQISIAAQHPATMVMLALDLPNTDVRQASNSMRTLITDANIQQMLPGGTSNTMVLVGTGAHVAGMAGLLRMVDQASAQPGALPSVAIEVVRLEHANAPEITHVLNQILAPSAAPQQQGQFTPGAELRVVDDARTNSVLVRGLPADVEMVKRIVRELDRAVD